jgi:DNA-binding ferritin-like protein (Dps family)
MITKKVFLQTFIPIWQMGKADCLEDGMFDSMKELAEEAKYRKAEEADSDWTDLASWFDDLAHEWSYPSVFGEGDFA